MGWKAFIASLVSSLAWPAALAFIFWILRDEVRKLLPKLSLKHGEFEASFKAAEEKLEEAEQQAAPNEPPLPQEGHAIPGQQAGGEGSQPAGLAESDRFELLASIAPRGAIAEMRFVIERAVDELMARHPELKPQKTFLGNVRQLEGHGVIAETAANLLNEIRKVGATAMHFPDEPSTEVANRYRELVLRAIPLLRSPPTSGAH